MRFAAIFLLSFGLTLLVGAQDSKDPAQETEPEVSPAEDHEPSAEPAREAAHDAPAQHADEGQEGVLTAEGARQIVRDAQAQALGGDVEGALALVDGCLAHAEGDAAFFLHYTRAWLLEQRANEEVAQRDWFHLAAEDAYGRALEIRPGHPQASENLALLLERVAELRRAEGDEPSAVDALERALSRMAALDDPDATDQERYDRQLYRSDLLRKLGRLEEAHDVYYAAYADALAAELATADVAAERIVELYPSFGAGWREALLADCERFAADGATHVALAGYLSILAASPALTGGAVGSLEIEALHGWLTVQSAEGGITPASLDQVPDFPSWIELNELRAAVARPLNAFAELRSWRDPEERHVAARVVRAMAEEMRLDYQDLELARAYRRPVTGSLVEQARSNALVQVDYFVNRRRLENAFEVYLQALNLAPAYAEYQSQPLAALAPAGIVKLAVALDLLLLLRNHRFLDPDETVENDLWTNYLGQERLAEVEADAVGVVRLHQVLGLVFAENDDWIDEGDRWRSAAFHLRAAMEKSGEADPYLTMILADGLRKAERYEEAFFEYNKAARLFEDAGDDGASRDAYRAAVDVTELEEERFDRELEGLRDYLGLIEYGFFPDGEEGWYVGASIGRREARIRDRDFENDLLGVGFPTDVHFSRVEDAYKVFVGYQFDAPVALEFGYTNLDTIRSVIDNTGMSDPDALAALAAELHPTAAEGLTGAVRANLFRFSRLTLTGEAGLWFWKGEGEVLVPGGTPAIVNIDRQGLDPLFGLGLRFEGWHGFSLRAEYERYFTDDTELDFASVGLEYAFD